MRTPLILTSLAVLLAVSASSGQTYVLQSYVIGSGALDAQSTNFIAKGTVAQPIIGTSSSTNFNGSWGFWYASSGLTSSTGGFFADLGVLLEGAYSSSGMMSAAIADTSFPTSQPFDGPPWNYTGTESVAAGFFSSNPTIVDWVYVEVRDTMPDPSSPPMDFEAARAGFVTTAGLIVDTNGVDPLHFPTLPDGTYYVVVDHRNHARAMSASGVATVGDTLGYDFRDAMAKAYSPPSSTDPMQDMGDGSFALFAADANRDQSIAIDDFATWLVAAKAAASGYKAADFNLDNDVDISDFALWLSNAKVAASGKVPN